MSHLGLNPHGVAFVVLLNVYKIFLAPNPVQITPPVQEEHRFGGLGKDPEQFPVVYLPKN